MRLWCLNPSILNGSSLVALWRDALKAREIIKGNLKPKIGCKQLNRFKALDNPLDGINQYLELIHTEATIRGFRFNELKLEPFNAEQLIDVNAGQLLYELSLLYHRCLTKDKRHAKYLVNANLFPLANSMFLTLHKRWSVSQWEQIEDIPDYRETFRHVLK